MEEEERIKRPYKTKQKYYTKFVNLIIKGLLDDGFILDKQNKGMRYYLKNSYGIFIPKALVNDMGLMIVTYKDLSIGYLEFDDFPFSPKPIFVYDRHKFRQTLNSIIQTHEEADIPREKINRIKHEKRVTVGKVHRRASFICRRGFLL